MTFYEAAVEVLRTVGRPLHYKKITEIAIKRGLLSHVGKTPELTMGSRLNQETRKDHGDAIVIRTRPGVFALRAWNDSPNHTPDSIQETVGPNPTTPHIPFDSPQPHPQPLSTLLLNASKHRRRRRRRRSERAIELARSLGTETASVHDTPPPQYTPNPLPPQPSPTLPPQPPLPPSGQALGLDRIADVCLSILITRPSPEPISTDELAQTLLQQHTLSHDGLNPTALVHTALLTDNIRRSLQHQRPRFFQPSPHSWDASRPNTLQQEILDAEHTIQTTAQHIQDYTQNTLSSLLLSLSHEALHHITLTLFERLQYRDLSIAHHNPDGTAILTATHNIGLSELRTAILLHTNPNQPTTAQHVTHLRGTLHHHKAHQGIIVSLGPVLPDAEDESRVLNLPPIHLIDRHHLAKLLTQHNIGVLQHNIPITLPDLAFFSRLTQSNTPHDS